MPTVLLWADPDDPTPDVAGALAPGAPSVIAPHWWADDDPRAALLTSFATARGQTLGTDVTLVGLGLGGTAAASLLLHQRRLGLSIGRVVLADVDWSAPDPISGTTLPAAGSRPPETTVDVLGDDEPTREAVSRWSGAGWSVVHHRDDVSLASLLAGPGSG